MLASEAEKRQFAETVNLVFAESVTIPSQIFTLFADPPQLQR